MKGPQQKAIKTAQTLKSLTRLAFYGDAESELTETKPYDYTKIWCLFTFASSPTVYLNSHQQPHRHGYVAHSATCGHV